MRRVAAIDCGTNSLRLLIADIGGGALTDVVRELEIVRLGQGVDRTGRFAPEALARTFTVCERYAELIAEHRAVALRFCATSAARDVSNVDAFVEGVRLRLGVEPEIVSGTTEAELSYAGAVRDLGGLRGVDGRLLDDPTLVVDIGGGSTEFIEGVAGTARRWQSLDIGSVRLTERHLHGDPPTRDQVAAAEVDVEAAVSRLGMDLSRVRSVVGVAGTVTTVAAHALEAPMPALEAPAPGAPAPGRRPYPGSTARRPVHHAQLPVETVLRSCRALMGATVDERLAMPFMHPGRADVIGGGALILRHLLERLVPTLSRPCLVVSEHDILDGIAWSLASP